MSGETTLSFRVTISFLSLVILLMFTPSQLIFAQSSTEQLPFLTQKESIKILIPVTTQNATVIFDLTKMLLQEELRGWMIFLDGNSF